MKGFLEDAKRNGRIVAGGEALSRKGYFVQPTIVRDIGDDTRLVKEEQFGPILPVLRYTDIDDAVARANDTTYGLGGSIWSADVDRATHVAARIHSGTVWVNKHLGAAAVQAMTPAAARAIVGAGSPDAVITAIEAQSAAPVGGLPLSVVLLPSLKDALDELNHRLGPNMDDWTWGGIHHATFVPAAVMRNNCCQRQSSRTHPIVSHSYQACGRSHGERRSRDHCKSEC